MPLLPEQINRESVPIYPHVQPAVPDMVALGQQSVLLYNGLVLNDRLRPDRYLITSLEGLGGADIRDTRTPKPVAHGEIPYDAFLSGKTITITGRMEAGSIYELSRMERDLRAAFSPLVESPLKFNWWDVEDEFSDSVTTQAFWKTLKGKKFITTGNGLYVPQAAEPSIVYYSKRSYDEVRVVTAITCNTPLPTGEAGIVLCAKSSEEYIYVSLKTEAGELSFHLIQESPTFGGSTFVESVLPNSVYWIDGRVFGNYVEVKIYEVDPIENPNAQPIVEFKENLVGAGLEKWGEGQTGYAGLISTTTEFAFEKFYAQGIYPGDFAINCRSISAPQIKDPIQVATDKFRREFMLTLRASDPKIPGVMRLNDSRVLGSAIHSTNFTVVNRGSWEAFPILRFDLVSSGSIGAWTNPELVNLTTGEKLALEAVIGKFPEELIVDCGKQTIVNQNGENQFKVFLPTSSFISLAPGPNQLYLTGGATGNFARLRIEWQHTWI